MKKIWELSKSVALIGNLHSWRIGFEYDPKKGQSRIQMLPFLILQISHRKPSGESFSDDLLRQYLLGLVSEETREQIEVWLDTDENASGRLERIEDDIIEDYLAGCLAPGLKIVVENFFLITDARRDRLRFSEMLAGFVRPPKKKNRIADH